MRKRSFDIFKNHKQDIARNFSRAALHYDRYSAFQRFCGDRLCTLIGKLTGKCLLDAGCGTGWFSRHWKKQNNRVIALDLSHVMLTYARQKCSANTYIVGDIEKLPLATESIDSIFSNLAVQWCDSLPQVLIELNRVIRPGGIIALSTLVAGSLVELEQAWGRVDNNIHVNTFLSEERITKVFSRYRHRLFIEPYRLYYPRLIDLLKSIQKVGAGYLYNKRTKGLITQAHLCQVEANWPRRSSLLQLSYRVAYGILHRE